MKRNITIATTLEEVINWCELNPCIDYNQVAVMVGSADKVKPTTIANRIAKHYIYNYTNTSSKYEQEVNLKKHYVLASRNYTEILICNENKEEAEKLAEYIY